MEYIADLHIHSHYSRATSQELNPENLYRAARQKGLQLVGSGDFTHPAWRQELRDKFILDENSQLYRLRPEAEASLEPTIQVSGRDPVRFVLSGEISSIYKKNGKTRKIHNVILLPTLDAADRLSAELAKIGNIHSDGRPIFGLDAHNLLDLTLSVCPEAIFIPAHIWTPHFSLFGSESGFDSFEECFEDLAGEIHALETGLSSDPAMNWRLSMLDRFTLVSNSDAHSPDKLGREANILTAEFSYNGLREALAGGQKNRLSATIEFFPEEGKYHLDGHRNCHLCQTPQETLRNKGLCPVCGRKVTIGVLHRVEQLADRPEGCEVPGRTGFESLVPLREILSEVLGVGAQSQKVDRQYQALLASLGSELAILRCIPVEAIREIGGILLAEGIKRVRAREVVCQAGYDGEYGIIRVFKDGEREQILGQKHLFPLAEPATPQSRKSGLSRQTGQHREKTAESTKVDTSLALPAVKASPSENTPVTLTVAADRDLLLHYLNGEQIDAINQTVGPVVIKAGPGSGKTRTLTYKILALHLHHEVPLENILAITFTNKAAAELETRFGRLYQEYAGPKASLTPSRPHVGTFHRICHAMLQTRPEWQNRQLIDPWECQFIIREVLQAAGLKHQERKLQEALSYFKNTGQRKYPVVDDETPSARKQKAWEKEFFRLYEAYQAKLREYNLLDYDEIILACADLLRRDEAFLSEARQKFRYILVDEFQDINPLQYEFIRLLAGNGERLFVIGDPDQSIYGFRGANHTFFQRLGLDYPTSHYHALTRNYRSTEKIVRAAGEMLRQGSSSAGLALTATRPKGASLKVVEVADELAEGISVVKEIGRLIGGKSMLEAHGQIDSEQYLGDIETAMSFADIAVLFRTGAQAKKLEECLIKEGLPYRVVGQTSLLERKSVRSFLSFNQALLQPNNDFRVILSLKNDLFKLPESVISTLRLEQQQHPQPLFATISGFIEQGYLPSAQFQKLLDFHIAFKKYQDIVAKESPAQIIRQWITDFNLDGDEDLKDFEMVATNFATMTELLDHTIFHLDQDWERRSLATAANSEAITLMTLHAAKGLEFPIVFITGVEEGIIPFCRERMDHDEAEERRLFYVGMTRAMDRLYLIHTRTRTIHGQKKKTEISRYVEAIPPGCFRRSSEIKDKSAKPSSQGTQLSLF
jgi:uncharacterized protein (TIGR00375 family)